ncbi:aminoacyl trna synthase complex-interacting multifunctional protein [Holotrichia oblita]|uniref:Aminoacyl trna synthase complex-interacting multifunctional protein n=1 Tax=Holotrichia oblita TaxID=644536 RepID=A0ACB9T320_HOLOL|nr:aminoacyl trna synthase complex-interacting multifunctional protein [Holotrichia oblita]
MNGPLKMYLMKPVVRHDLPVELPSCMYTMKNIHTVRNDIAITDTGHVSTTKENLDTFDQKNQAMPEMAALVARQEQILLQLADLKRQMLLLKENLKGGSSGQKVSVATFMASKFDTTDIVINVSPLHPPYFLEVLQKIWNERIYLNIESYLHSSVSELPNEAKVLIDKLQLSLHKYGDLPQLTVRIIWKDVGPHPELVVSKVPILGEVNILRYFARSTSSMNYETSNPFELDSILDTCYTLIQSKTKTDRSAAMHIINKKLGKSQWLCDRSEYTIADIAAYSSLKQIPQNEINVNLTKWLQKCEHTFVN